MFTTNSPTIFFFFFNDTATTEIYTLSLHDALPILLGPRNYLGRGYQSIPIAITVEGANIHGDRDRKSTRLNSSHANISYAVFCLKKKKKRTWWADWALDLQALAPTICQLCLAPLFL